MSPVFRCQRSPDIITPSLASCCAGDAVFNSLSANISSKSGLVLIDQSAENATPAFTQSAFSHQDNSTHSTLTRAQVRDPSHGQHEQRFARVQEPDRSDSTPSSAPNSRPQRLKREAASLTPLSRSKAHTRSSELIYMLER